MGHSSPTISAGAIMLGVRQRAGHVIGRSGAFTKLLGGLLHYDQWLDWTNPWPTPISPSTRSVSSAVSRRKRSRHLPARPGLRCLLAVETDPNRAVGRPGQCERGNVTPTGHSTVQAAAGVKAERREGMVNRLEDGRTDASAERALAGSFLDTGWRQTPSSMARRGSSHSAGRTVSAHLHRITLHGIVGNHHCLNGSNVVR